MAVPTGPHSWDFYVTRYKEASDLQNTFQNDVSEVESGNYQEIVQGYQDLANEIAKNPIWADLLTPGSAALARLAFVNQSVETYLQNITLRVEDPNHPGQYINVYEGTSSTDGRGNIQENYSGASAGSGHPAANLYDLVSGGCGSLFTDMNSDYIPNGGSSSANWSGAGGLNFNSQGKWVLVPTGYNPHDGERTYTSEQVGTNISASGSVSAWAQYLNLSQGSDPTALNNALWQG